MKKIWPFFLILLLITISGLGYLSLKLQGINNTLIVKVKDVNEQTKLYKINASYPLFEQAPESFNNQIESQVKKSLADFKSNAETNWQIRQKSLDPGEKTQSFPSEPWPYTLNWSFQQLNPRYLSFVLSSDAFEGGANTIQQITTYNYSLLSRRNVLLADLIPNQDYLDRISKYCQNQLKDQFKDNPYVVGEFLNQGTAPKEENFKNFTFDENSITFYFPKYQVAPGSYGEQRCVMPRNFQ